jgi:ribosome-associated translation inhibitor RaiA
MKLEIRGRHVHITRTIRAHVERRLGFALDRFAARIRIVRLKVGDVNGLRGGVDKHCQLAVWFMHSSPIILESRDLTVLGAIDRVFNKVGCVVARHFGNNRNRQSSRSVRNLFEPPSFSVGIPSGEE